MDPTPQTLVDAMQYILGALSVQLMHSLPQIKNWIVGLASAHQRKAKAEARKAEAEADAAERSMQIEAEEVYEDSQ